MNIHFFKGVLFGLSAVAAGAVFALAVIGVYYIACVV